MTFLDPRWDDLSDADWAAFSISWIAELGGNPDVPSPPTLPWLLDDAPTAASGYVVPMNFTASPQAQWKFIVAAYQHGNEKSHPHLAAGPVEHLLGKHGDEYIAIVEQAAAADPLFSKMLQGCYQNQMSDQVWRRVCNARGG